MKKTLRFIFLGIFFILASVHMLQAQRIRGALFAGTNVSQIDGDNLYGFHKWGANLGAGVIVPLNKKSTFFASMELLYSQKGSYEEFSPVDTGASPYYKATLNYAQIPFLLFYEDHKIVSGGIGFAWSRLVGVDEIEGGRQTASSVESSIFKKNDFSIMVDVRFRLYKQLKFNARYEYSLAPIGTKIYPVDGPVTLKNNVLTLRLIWVFNEKISEEALNDKR